MNSEGSDVEAESVERAACVGGRDPDPRWAKYMKWTIPECDAVLDTILGIAGRRRADVDVDRLLRAVRGASRHRLQALTTGRVDVTWESLRELVTAPGFRHGTLAAHLSTYGAVGIAINDKLAAYFTGPAPREFASRVMVGEFDIA